MITFDSFVNKDKKWEVQLKNDKELSDIYFENQEQEKGVSINGLTEYLTSKIYINEELYGFSLIKTIRHELMHVYLWETNKNNSSYTEDEVCEILSNSIPFINKTADDILSKLLVVRKRR